MNQKQERRAVAAAALKVCMPPNAPAGTTFAEVVESEYKCLSRASEHAREHCARMTKPLFHLTSHDPRALYRRKPLEIRPQAHIGQLKLFLSELQFLTEWGDRARKVVYAGSAEGTHIRYLKRLFPHLIFSLYDPRPFNPNLNNVRGISIHTAGDGMFTNTTAHKYAKPKERDAGILFISDIRSGSPDDPACDFDKCVARDMVAQRGWAQIMRPIASMFKFRLSYMPGRTVWLAPHSNSHLKYGIFATKSGTELRLISTDPDSLQEYDNTEMEEKSYYFNNFTRSCQYGPTIPGLVHSNLRAELGMDDCWDCCAMRDVCMAFLMKKHGEPSDCGTLAEEVSALLVATTPMPRLASDLCAQYACAVDEGELYGFIGEAIRNCGKAAQEKMKNSPHGARPPGVQWIDCMRGYNHAPMYSKKGKKVTFRPGVEQEIRRLYECSGDIAPPLGVHSGHR